MASPPSPLQLRSLDVPGVGSSALAQLNTFFRQVQQGLSNQLALTENNRAVIKSLDVTTADSWTTATLQNAWVVKQTSPPQYMKSPGGLVFIRGTIGAGANGTTAFTLPGAYQPLYQTNFQTWCSPETATRLLIAPGSGLVVPQAGNTNLFSVDCSFPAADLTPVSNLAQPVTFQHGLPARCTDLLLTQAMEKTTGSRALVAAVTPDWQDNGDGTVTLRNLSGLAPLRTYTLRLLCLSEPQ